MTAGTASVPAGHSFIHTNIQIVRRKNMPEITAAAVKALRERTGLPMMECKKALQETGGDEDAAVELAAQAGHQDARRPGSDAKRRPAASRFLPISPAGRRDDRIEVRKRAGGQQCRVPRNLPTTWPSNWRPAPAPRRPRNCSRSRRRRKPGQTLGDAEGRHVQPHSRSVQSRRGSCGSTARLRRLRPSRRQHAARWSKCRAATPKRPKRSPCT